MRYAEYFLGIGAPGKAINRVTQRHGDKCEFVYGFEIDKYARNAFCAIHGVDESKIYHDITQQPNTLPQVDIVFYSPPCQSFSIAGKKEGTTVDKGNLFYHALEGIKKSNPKFAIMENVANLKNQFKDDFRNMILALEGAGYVNYSKVLNSKNYGIPQNRERIFIVSVRKDIYEQGIRFEWPKPIKLEKRLKDVLEDEVGEKYYLSEQTIEGFIASTQKAKEAGNGFKFEPIDGECIAKSILTKPGQRKDDNFIKVETKRIGGLFDKPNQKHQAVSIWDKEGLSPTLKTSSGGYSEPMVIVNAQPKILVNSATKKGYEVAMEGDSINLDQPTSKTRRGRVGKGVAQTLTTACNQAIVKSKIRKLTPLECFRLQGFDDADYYKAAQAYDATYGLNKDGETKSDSQMYKRAGNSITVQVEEEMLENLLYQRKQNTQISLF